MTSAQPTPAIDDEDEALPNWKALFAILLAIGLPLTVLIRLFWIQHTWGAIGVGFTVGYAVVLALLWTDRAPRERRASAPAVMTPEAWIYVRLTGASQVHLSVVNTGETPLRIPAPALEAEVLQADRVVKRTTLGPTSDTPVEVPPTHYDFVHPRFDPEKSPSARTLSLDLAPALTDIPPGRYDLRLRGSPIPGTSVALGIFPITVP